MLIKKVCFGLVLSFKSIMGFCQSPIIDLNLSTGFVANSTDIVRTSFIFSDLNDSLMLLDFNNKKYSADLYSSRDRFIIKKSDLSIQNQFQIWNPLVNKSYSTSQQPYYVALPVNLTDKLTNEKYYLENYTDTNGFLNINVSHLLGLVNKGTNIFSFQQQNKALKSIPMIYDSMLYVYLTNFNGDTAFVESIDFSGNMVLSNAFYNTGFTPVEFPYFEYSIGPTAIHPQNDSFLIFQDQRSPQIQLINRFSLDTAGLISLSPQQKGLLGTNYGWSTIYGAQYRFYQNYFKVSGSVVQFPFINQGNSNIDFDYYYLDLDYNGNIIGQIELGDDSTYNRGYGFDCDGGKDYYVGSSPYRYTSPYAPEYRKILVYQDSTNIIDSVFLFGNKNHVAYEIIADNGDLYILSEFSNAWSDDSVFISVSKVSSQIFTSIKKFDSKTTSLQIYPNPTTELVKLSTFNKGDVYYIYDIQGSIIKENYVPEDGVINVSSFTNGTYFIKLSRKGVISQRATAFIKH